MSGKSKRARSGEDGMGPGSMGKGILVIAHWVYMHWQGQSAKNIVKWQIVKKLTFRVAKNILQ